MLEEQQELQPRGPGRVLENALLQRVKRESIAREANDEFEERDQESED